MAPANTTTDVVANLTDTSAGPPDSGVEATSALVSAIGGALWPLIVIGVVLMFRRELAVALSALGQFIGRVEEVKVGEVVLRGLKVSASEHAIPERNEDKAKLRAAAEADQIERQAIYDSTQSLMLVHVIAPSKETTESFGKRTFDVSVYLRSHFGEGTVSDVRKVTYYFGKHWGAEDHKFGSRYEMTNADEDFALTVTDTADACLCVAEIHFKDGKVAKTYRYLDVEMAPAFGVPLRMARD